MTRLHLVLVMLALAALGCNLTNGSLAQSTPTPIPLTDFAEESATDEPTLAPTLTPLPTAQQLPTTVPRSSSGAVTTGTSDVVLPTNCTPQTGWPVYTVVRGDTLYAVAQRTSSTVAALTTANCLSNPNTLEVGQQLRVPSLPVTVTRSGAVRVVELTPISPYNYSAPPGTWITLQWPEAAWEAVTRVEFYAEYTVPVQQAQTLGSDTALADGASLVIHLTEHESIAVIRASAFNGSQLVQQTSTPITINAMHNMPVDVGQVQISPAEPEGNNLWRVTPGTIVTLTWPGFNSEAQYVEFRLYPTAGDPTSEQLGVDSTLADGASIQWSVPEGVTGYIHATAVLPGPLYQNTLIGASVIAGELPQPTGTLVFTPGELEGGWYKLPAEETVTITWEDAPDDFASVSFYLTPTGTGTADLKSAFGSDEDSTDGASLELDLSAVALGGHVHAEAVDASGQVVAFSQMVNAYVE